MLSNPDTQDRNATFKKLIEQFKERGAIRCPGQAKPELQQSAAVANNRKRRATPHYRDPEYMKKYMRDRRNRWHAMGLNSRGELPKRPVIGGEVMDI